MLIWFTTSIVKNSSGNDQIDHEKNTRVEKKTKNV